MKLKKLDDQVVKDFDEEWKTYNQQNLSETEQANCLKITLVCSF